MMRALLLLCSTFVLSACGLPRLTTAYFAKEVCSCSFVSQQDEEFCVNYGQPSLSMSSYQIDREAQLVRARKWLAKSEARYISPRHGCELIEKPSQGS